MGWLKSQSIAPHIPVWDKSARDDGARSDFAYSAEQDIYICSQGKRLKTNGMLHDGKTLLYERANTIVSRARITPPRNRSEPRIWLVLSEGVMTFMIHASKNGQSVVTVRISPAVAVDKARVLESLGWQVHVTDSAGNQFDPSDFDRLSSLADETA